MKPLRVGMALLVLVVAGWGWGLLPAGSQTPAGTGGESAVRAAIAGYAAAMKSGDLKLILGHWAEDADFTDEAGVVHKGRQAIGKLYEPNLKELKEGSSSIQIDNLRLITPNVATMEGNVEFTPAGGALETNRFSAVWALKDGRWLIASARDLPEREGDAADRGVKQMQWLAGDWIAEDKGATVKLNVRPELDGKFALMRYEIRTGEGTMTVLQILGYDPVERTMRAWAFDSRGGFGESLWTRNGGVWVSDTVGVLPSGQTGSSVNTIRAAGPDSFVWRSTERQVEGQPIPDHELKYTRVPKK